MSTSKKENVVSDRCQSISSQVGLMHVGRHKKCLSCNALKKAKWNGPEAWARMGRDGQFVEIKK